MRSRIALIRWVRVFLLCSLFVAPMVHARSPGQIKAMNQRADTVINQKNRFVIKVLQQYGMSCETDINGMITRINAHGDWVPVRKLDIVPVPKEGGEADKVVGHEVLIYTDGETVRLFSEIKVR
ncbi:MAG TPA: hypothetical protein VMW89_02160 [Desulfatiglandales bacterium]|nr:hypothetical protein [Desulfatiglandales bacterium]